jgi:predicted dehydrogenase
MSQKLTRRNWIAQTAGAAAAVGLTGRTLILNGAEDAPSRRITVGVMGLSRGLALSKTFGTLPGVTLKYICEVDSERLAQGRSAIEKSINQTPQTVEDFRRILDDREVDVLVCAAPNHWHAPAAILACSAGKHVYVEKPCSHNPREGELLVEAARKHNRAVQMGNQRRTGVGFQQAVSMLKEGAIGKVYLARAWYNAARGTIGRGMPTEVPARLDYDLWQGPAPRREYVSNLIPYNWHWFWHWGNGELGNNGIHTLDLLRWGLGADYPIRVTSSGGRYAFEDDQETPDTHTVSFEFEGGRAATWQCLSCNRHDRGQFIAFYGSGGSMDISDQGAIKVFDEQDKLVKEVPNSMTDADHVTNLLTAIRSDQPLNLNSEILEGHKSTLLCHLGNIAHRTGRTINCDPSNGHIVGDEDAAKL